MLIKIASSYIFPFKIGWYSCLFISSLDLCGIGLFLTGGILLLVFMKYYLYGFMMDVIHNLHLCLVHQLLCLLILPNFLLFCCPIPQLPHWNIMTWCWGPPCGTRLFPFLVFHIYLSVDHGYPPHIPKYFFLEPLSVFVFRFVISCFNYGVFIVISISDWVSRYPLKTRLTINHLWRLL